MTTTVYGDQTRDSSVGGWACRATTPLGFVQNATIKSSLSLFSSASQPIWGLGPQSRKLLFSSHLTGRDRALERETNLRPSLIETLSEFSPLLPACRIK